MRLENSSGGGRSVSGGRGRGASGGRRASVVVGESRHIDRERESTCERVLVGETVDRQVLEGETVSLDRLKILLFLVKMRSRSVFLSEEH